MSEVFYWVLNMSITAIVSGLVVMLLRKIRKLPKRLVFALWIIPFFRLCVPVGLSSKYSLMTILNRIFTRAVTIKPLDSQILEFSASNYIAAADTYEPFTYKSIVLEKIFNIGAFCWILVMALLLMLFVISYLVNMKKFRKVVPYSENLYLSEETDTPCVVGIIKPRIIIPEEMKVNEYVIAHEKAHIKNLDNLWRVVAILVAIVHWFNPFVWLFLKLFFDDMEQACDERVIRTLEGDKLKEYAITLINTAAQKNVFVSTINGGNVRNRIENIMSYKKLTIFATLVFGGFCLIVSYVLLTNAI